MKKIVLGTVLLLLVFNQNAFSRDAETAKWELSAMGGGGFPTEADIDNTGYYGGRLTYDIEPNVAIGVESGWMGWKNELNGTDYGTVNGIPILADLIMKMPIKETDNHLVPYGVVGVGVILWEYSESKALKDLGIKVDDGESSLAVRLGVGADYYVNDNWAIFVEGSYLFSSYKGTIGGGGVTVADKTDTDAAFIGGGIKYRF